MEIRTMTQHDWEAVKSIYESGIETGIATFETSAPSWEKWDEGHLEFGRLVAIENNEVLGWAAISPVSSRCVYGGVAEVSIYIANNHKGKGIGKSLLQNLIMVSEKHGIWTLQAGIFTDNTASVRLHEKSGFRVIGYREKIGKLNGRWKDNFILERRSGTVGVD
jgi:L-amino acid N-acyltransferase YncA